jgi:DNA mismatch repair protein MSH5
MDTHIGDLHPSIVDREIEIIQSLLDEILIYDEAMGNACDVCAELDCLLSFAEASRAYDYQRPYMVDDNVINITQGRYKISISFSYPIQTEDVFEGIRCKSKWLIPSFPMIPA